MRALQVFEVALKAFIVRDDALLMVREAAGEKLWELPGGRIEVGEEHLPAGSVLRRELVEELGPSFHVEIGDPVATFIRPAPERNAFVFLVGFLCADPRGQIELSSEHVEYGWHSREACASLALAPGYEEALARLWR